MDVIPLRIGRDRPTAAEENSTTLSGLTIFVLCAAFLAGPAYNSYLHYDFSHSPDSNSYMRIARGDFDVPVTHRYRIVVPFLAKALSIPLEKTFGLIWPHRDVADHHLRFGFFLVNGLMMSLVGLTLFRTCEAYDLSAFAAGAAVLAFLASRWSNYLASLPLVDSFHLLCVALTFLAIRTQNARLLMLAIVLGPISKESFLLIAPATFLFGNVRVWVQMLLYAGAAVFVGVIHLLIDFHFPTVGVGSVQNALQHFHNIGFSLQRACSPGGLGEIFTVLGLFNLVWLWALTRKNRCDLLKAIDAPLWFLLASVVVQALISTSLARMLFVAGPFWVVLLGQSIRLMRQPPALTHLPVSVPDTKVA